ncbi:MAG: hypothetical protein M1339_02950 [Bacteroidetes bacterium]|nr:hypothetical protein [Bacteroidota bacterium]
MNKFAKILFVLVTGVIPLALGHAQTLKIKAAATSIPMGQTVVIKAHLRPSIPGTATDYLLLPYVNHRRWGAQEYPDSNGSASFVLPLPNAGSAGICVVAVKREKGDWMGSSDPNLLLVGSPMRRNEGLCSNRVNVRVTWRRMPSPEGDGHIFCVQYEPWFDRLSSWSTAEAVPLLGFYESNDENVIRQHILWFIDSGINAVMLDWSNHIWGCRHWDQRSSAARSIINNTTFFLEELAKMRDEGLRVPKVVLMPGLSNGPPASMTALNEEISWIYQNYILDPRLKGLFLTYDGKPLIIILDTGAIGDKRARTSPAFRIPYFKQSLRYFATVLDSFRAAQGPIDSSHFAVRYMSSQNQLTHYDKLGYWSWMDGQLKPVVTYCDGKPEAVTVTPSFFGRHGWTAPGAVGRLCGWTYLKTFDVALEHKPRIVFLHQFNEFAGQKEGEGYGKDRKIFLDEYDNELSDDIEPTSLTSGGYRDRKTGWGFYYLNMTKALLDVFRGKSKGSTILAVAPPDVHRNGLFLKWAAVGPVPRNYTILIDGKAFVKKFAGQRCTIPIGDLPEGDHVVTILANGVGTYYSMSHEKFSDRSYKRMLCKVSEPFQTGK